MIAIPPRHRPRPPNLVLFERCNLGLYKHSAAPLSSSHLFLHVTLLPLPLLLLPSSSRRTREARPELANTGDFSVLEEEQSERVVHALYEALNDRNVEAVHRLLQPDIGWWFHGPPSCQHMMRLLTGASPDESFFFDPVSIASFGSTVLVEGQGWSRGSTVPVQWIHAWTVTDGIITQVREYFNTSLTVTRLGGPDPAALPPSAGSRKFHCVPLWQSRLSGGAGKKSVPGLVLAI